jgi:hypothetical protein
MASHVVSKLTKEYARLQGRYEVIEREIEYVVGVKQILAEINRIEGVKRGMRARLDQIAAIVMQLEPGWQRERVDAIYPRDRKPGVLSKVVYEILRRAKEPLKTREIARLAAAKLDIEPIQRELLKLESAVQNALKLRVGKTIIIASEKPIRWAVMPRDQVVATALRVSQGAPALQDMVGPPRPTALHPHIQSSAAAASVGPSRSQSAESLA